MYEEMTFEKIESEMLERVREDLDKREGSLIWDATATVAFSLAEMFFLLEHYPDLVMPDTAVGEYLDRTLSVYGITRKQAIKAIRKVTTDADIEVGSRWQIGDVVFVIIEKVAEGEYEAECEQAGQVGNRYSGIMMPLVADNTAEVYLGEVLFSGTDEETDDDFRDRFFRKVQRPSTSGNVHDYYNWAMECDGVGDAKVFPATDSPGYVDVVIVDANKAADPDAMPELVERVKQYIETVRPIGATVNVEAAAELPICINANVKHAAGITLDKIINDFKSAVTDCLKENAFELKSISAARIGSMLLNVAGVEDYEELVLSASSAAQETGADSGEEAAETEPENGSEETIEGVETGTDSTEGTTVQISTTSIAVGERQIAVLGDVSLGVM